MNGGNFDPRPPQPLCWSDVVGMASLGQRLYFHGKHRRQVADDGLPDDRDADAESAANDSSVCVAVYRRMREMASTMSCRRRALSLGGTHGLIEDALAQLRLERLASDQVHWPPQQFLQATPQPREFKQGHWTCERY